jgi:hypothetical protein
MDLLKAIYQIPGKSQQVYEFFRLVYRELSLGISQTYLEAQYQNFRRVLGSPDGFPLTLGEFQPGDTGVDIEKAFEWLSTWETAFDGLKHLWIILKANPQCDFGRRFDKLQFGHKQFLIEGLRLANKEENDENDAFAERIAELIEVCEQRALAPRPDVDGDVERVKAKADGVSKSVTSPVARPSPERRQRARGLGLSPIAEGDVLSFTKD